MVPVDMGDTGMHREKSILAAKHTSYRLVRKWIEIQSVRVKSDG